MEKEEILRFSRQILLPKVGLSGQEKILQGKALIVGVGALGTVAALYLAAAGVGTLGLVDGDRVEIHNLHRQVLFGEEDVGRLKVEAAREKLLVLRKNLRVETYPMFLTAENAEELLPPYDVILCGADDFAPRYALSDAAVRLKKPWIDASILGLYGQATAFWPGEGCYRCLQPEPPPLEVAGTCAQRGVMGPLAGHLGTLQAMEALKVLLGEKPSLAGTLLTVDLEDLQYRSFRWQRNPSCPACNGPLSDPFQERPGANREDGEMVALSPEEVLSLREEGALLVDVREREEAARDPLPGAMVLPLGELYTAYESLPRDRPIILCCPFGLRSRQGALFLKEKGYRAFYGARDLLSRLDT